ncbi:flagellar protein FlaG [Kordiimonas sp. SCSIO 12610]|uniref:flagellar protein FlaG n=1 Tax=Kordiimonas sp. SCSIO 12610 TaxID=2829597 RepID=UPI002109C16D|nr:flagellar protein FlaG [Kordiimonas sp. SCSIO 12610]UTW54194.1 flagellar protein FlaG [Kordiimonas sp. SCSIO 12610]
MAEINTSGSFAQGVSLRSTTANNTNITVPQSVETDVAPELAVPETSVADAISDREALQARRDALELDDSTDPLAQAAEAISEFIPDTEAFANTTLRIEQDEATGRFVYQSIDNASGEVLRQFPPEQILEFLAFYREPEGIVVDDEA